MADTKLTALTELTAPALDDWLYAVDKSDTTDDAAGSSRKMLNAIMLGQVGAIPGGRLTLETGVPISTTDQTAKGTLYYTPSVSDNIRIYNGTAIKQYLFTERSLSLTLTSGKNYDVFIYDNSGTLTLELSAAWTTDTARADALAWQSGIGYVKSGTATRLWLGTIRASGTNTCEDSLVKRFVWNAYNQVGKILFKKDTTLTWTYSTDGYQQARAQTANQVEIVTGLSGANYLDLAISASCDTSADISCLGVVAIGEDSTTTPHTQCQISPAILNQTAGHVLRSGTHGKLRIYPSVGYHKYCWLESGNGTGTVTWLGERSSGTIDFRSALYGTISG